MVGIDISEEAITSAQKAGAILKHRVESEFLCGRIESLGLKDASFDKIFSFCVIEHVPNYEEVLSIMHKLLKPNGELIFSADSMEALDDDKILEQHRQRCSIAQYFREDMIRSLLEKIGFFEITIYPSYRSEYARQLWIQVLKKDFHIGVLPSVIGYFKVCYHEARCPKDRKGLFLLVKCRKARD